MLHNLESATSDYSKLEVVVKVDDDIADAVATMESERTQRPFSIRYVCTPRHSGVFTLWAGQNEAFEIADLQSHFFLFASDELRILTPGWDQILEKYVGFFEDDIFRLRGSFCKYRNYHKIFDCTFMPESFALMTGKWMQVTGGTGHCWGTDAFHQCIAYHLSTGPGGDNNLWHSKGLWRDVQLHDIEFGGTEFGKDISAREFFARNLRIYREWDRLCSYKSQLHFAYLARRLSLYCKAQEMNLEKFQISDFRRIKNAALVDSQSSEVVYSESYALPRWSIWRENFVRRLLTAPIRTYRFILIISQILVYPREKFSEPVMAGQEFSNFLRENRPLLFKIVKILKILRGITPRRLMRRIPFRLRRVNPTDHFIRLGRFVLRDLLGLKLKAVRKPKLPYRRFPRAAGLEWRFNPMLGIVNQMMRFIGYPVGEKARMREAFNKILINTDSLEKLQFGNIDPVFRQSLDKLETELAPLLHPFSPSATPAAEISFAKKKQNPNSSPSPKDDQDEVPVFDK